MGALPLTRGFSATVDDADLAWLSQWKWCAYTHGRSAPITFAARKPRTGTIHLARLVAATPPGLDVFHWDRDRLNCTRLNLTNCTRAQTLSARPPPPGRRFKGISRQGSRWVAHAGDMSAGNSLIGAFRHEEDAARAYDARALELWGRFAWLNFPDPVAT